MITFAFRAARVGFGGLMRPRLGYLDESVLRLRVQPADLDINVHMNNARYSALMDLGRVDLALRTGAWRLLLGRRLQAVLGGAQIRYRRPLKLFQPVLLRSRLIGWDEKWLYLEHRIEGPQGVLACSAVVKGAFVGKPGVVSPRDLASSLGFSPDGPALPPWVEQWKRLEQMLEDDRAAGEKHG